ncbi:MAG: HEPN domain-containing protein, partial [Sulfolobales archaeon]
MNNVSMAQSYLRQAEERIRHAKEALERGNYPYVVRQCQESVELLLKAALRLVGVEVPKWHDVGPVLKREAQRFPEWFQVEIPALARISRKLRRERELSMYGDEESGIPPDELY